MELTFLGTRGEIKPHSRRHRRHSSLLIQHGDARIMLDCGADCLCHQSALARTDDRRRFHPSCPIERFPHVFGGAWNRSSAILYLLLRSVCLKISERNLLGSAGGILPTPPFRLALPARPKLLSEGGNRSGKDDFKFFFGGKFFCLFFQKFLQTIEHHIPVLFGMLAGFLGRVIILRERDGCLRSIAGKFDSNSMVVFRHIRFAH